MLFSSIFVFLFQETFLAALEVKAIVQRNANGLDNLFDFILDFI